METKEEGYVKKVMASLCHFCPVCPFGRRNPDSLVGRVLRHSFHADRCPFWEAVQKRYGEGLV
jgi:hypothetical protein